MGKLTDLKARKASPGVYGDGRGLYLRVKKPNGKGEIARSWVLRVQQLGRRQDIGLGGYPETTLEMARDKALILRRAAKEGESPRAVRDAKRQRVHTFAEAMLEAHKEVAKSVVEKNALAFLATLKQYAVPTLGNLPVDRIGTAEVVRVLLPLWAAKPELGRKIDTRIRKVLDLSVVRGWRKEPAPTRRQLQPGLPAQPRGGHLDAMPYGDVPGFVASQLTLADTAGRLALRFAIFTAARSGEVRQAKWEQIDFEARTWSRPADVMKMKEPHVVTLNDAAIDVLTRAKALGGAGGLVFPSPKGKPLSDMTLTKVLRDAKIAKVTVHGFRSSFRDWAADETNFPREIAEAALAHKVGSDVELAYRRTDYRERRRPLLDAWGRFVAPSLTGANSNEISGGAQAA